MYPETVLDYIPLLYRDDPGAQALASKLDSILASIRRDLDDMKHFYTCDRVRSIFLDELGLWLNAGVNVGDSERTKRQKICTAVAGHKNVGTWKFDFKPKIDAVSGYDSEIISSVGTGSWIVVGDGLEPSSYYWSSVGADGIDDELGIEVYGDGLRGEDPGVIRINIHPSETTPVISEETYNAIRADLEPSEPAYYLVILGYQDSSGLFISYDAIYGVGP